METQTHEMTVAKQLQTILNVVLLYWGYSEESAAKMGNAFVLPPEKQSKVRAINIM